MSDTSISLTITTDDPDVVRRVMAALQPVQAIAAADPQPAYPAKSAPPESAFTDLDPIDAFAAGDRSPEVLAVINDPAVSVPEQVAAQKTYPFAAGDLT